MLSAPPTHICPQCGLELPLTEVYFPKDSKRKHGLSSWCRPCSRRKKRESNARIKQSDPEAWLERRRAYVASYKVRYPERVRASDRRQKLRGKFGITEEEYQALLAKQNGCCAICGDHPDKKALAVDHCHDSGQIRGLLCGKCNTALGLMDDNAQRLAAASEYLNRGK